jgi:hypothetical protein
MEVRLGRLQTVRAPTFAASAMARREKHER